MGGTLHRVAGSVLLSLDGVGVLGIGGQDGFLLPAHHQDHVLRRQKIQPGQDVVEQGLPVGQPHHLGQIHALCLEPGALSGGQHQRLYLVIHAHSPSCWISVRSHSWGSRR